MSIIEDFREFKYLMAVQQVARQFVAKVLEESVELILSRLVKPTSTISKEKVPEECCDAADSKDDTYTSLLEEYKRLLDANQSTAYFLSSESIRYSREETRQIDETIPTIVRSRRESFSAEYRSDVAEVCPKIIFMMN